MTNIRLYVAINEMIQRTAPSLLSVNMPGVLIGPAFDERNDFASDLNFSAKNDTPLSKMLTLDNKGRIFEVAGAREGSTVLIDSLKWGAKKVTSPIDFGDEEYHVHVKSANERHILILEKGDKFVTEDDLIHMGAEKGDSILIDPPTKDDKPFLTTIRKFDKDKAGNVLIYLWEEVPYSVGDGDSLTAHESKHFEQVRLISEGFTYEAAPFSTTSVHIKGPGKYLLDYYVYEPTDKKATLNNIKVSVSKINITNYQSHKITARASEGTLYNFFIASRTDLSKSIISVNYNNYEDIFGKPSALNKMGTAFSLMAKEIPGFDMYAYITEDDTTKGYTEALNTLATSKTAYEVAVLTDNEEVMGVLKGMLQKANDPMISAFKMGLFSGKIPFYSKKMAIPHYTVTKNPDNTYTIIVPTGGFAVSDVEEGDYIIGNKDLEIANEEYYTVIGETYSSKIVARITSVVTDSKIIVKAISDTIDVVSALSSQEIIVLTHNTNDEMINIINNRTESLDNMHMVYMVPDKFVHNNKIYAGYFLSAVLVGVLAHLPPQQGISNLSFNVVDKIINSAFLFTDDELDRIAVGGALVVTQISYDSKPYIIRQLTTNMSSLEEMEVNKVRCLDYAAIEIKKTINDYVGKRNVTERNVSDLRLQIVSVLNNIVKSTNNDLLGSIITSYVIGSLAIPAEAPDEIVGDISVVTPTSLNAISLAVKAKS